MLGCHNAASHLSTVFTEKESRLRLCFLAYAMNKNKQGTPDR
jgi:hypothetical protein